MKLLFVHERFGSLAGAEANAHITATELGKPSKYNTPLKGRMYCKYRALYWKLRGLDRKPKQRDVFT